MLISIVVTSYSADRFEDAKDLLHSIEEQTTTNFEVVYVTERSRRLYDAIKEVTQSLEFDTKVIHNDGKPGLAEARNLGASVASGDIIAFVDDDVILDKGWSEAVENAFRMFSNVAAITGPAYPLWVGKKADWLPVELDWLIGCTRWFQSKSPVEVRNCWGMNMAFKSSLFKELKGFSFKSGFVSSSDLSRIGEDLELSLRIRRANAGNIYYIPSMRVFSKVYPHRLGIRFVVERSRWIGYTRRNIKKMLGRKTKTHGQESNLLRGLLLSFFDPRSMNQISIDSLFKRYRISILTLLTLLVGYLMGPV